MRRRRARRPIHSIEGNTTVTDPNLPDQPGAPVPPATPATPPAAPATPPAPAYGAPAAPAYGETAPAYGQQPTGPKTNTLAIISLVASIAGFVIWGIGFIAGVICGHIALSQIKKTGEQGHGMAVAGLIVGYIGIALTVIGTIIFFAVFAAFMSNPDLRFMY